MAPKVFGNIESTILLGVNALDILRLLRIKQWVKNLFGSRL